MLSLKFRKSIKIPHIFLLEVDIEEGEILQVMLCLRIADFNIIHLALFIQQLVCSQSLSLVCIIISLGLDLQIVLIGISLAAEVQHKCQPVCAT